MNQQPGKQAGSEKRLVLLTGATGYVGGRLLAALERRGERVRCFVRRPEEFRARSGHSAEVVGGDIRDRRSVEEALRGVDTAYYLIHSMGRDEDYLEEDRQAARNFCEAARAAGVRRIVYLGGLGHGEHLSPHLASRQEVGRILRDSGVPALEFRAAIILGSGSISFELIRSLVDRLPAMVTPRWTRMLTQPISIEDVIAYLSAAIDLPGDESRVIEIGGCDQVSYGGLMREYARQRGLRRLIIPVPVLTTRLSSLWLGLVTSVYARIGRELIEGLRNETVVKDDSARRLFPEIAPRSVSEAISRALRLEDEAFARTRWCDAFSSGGSAAGLEEKWGGATFGRRLVDSRSAHVPFSPERAFGPIARIGGGAGWYHANFLWRLRGFLDLLVGGVGLRRGRLHPERLRVGDTVDFWRVEAIEPDRLLRLAAEMKVPGRAWLQFEVQPEGGGSIIRQTAIFDPKGIEGRIYWYLLYPLHSYVFAGMLRGIVAALEGRSPGTIEPKPSGTASGNTSGSTAER